MVAALDATPQADVDYPAQVELLYVFGNHGFRGAAMARLAEAAGVSRQTLYNRFGDKEGVFAWAVEGVIATLRARAVAELARDELPTRDAVARSLEAWLGPVVPLLHNTRHGAEILDLTARRQHEAAPDRFAEIRAPLEALLLARGVCATAAEAADRSFLLAAAAKGLMLTSHDMTAFRDGLAQAIAGAIPFDSAP